VASRRKGPVSPGDADLAMRSFLQAKQSAAAQQYVVQPEAAVAEALRIATDGRVDFAADPANGTVTYTPANLMNLTFASPKVGLTDEAMPEYLQTLAMLLDSNLGSRIVQEVEPSAAQRIGQLCELIRLWQRA
jgi:hypothetical protein